MQIRGWPSGEYLDASLSFDLDAFADLLFPSLPLPGTAKDSEETIKFSQAQDITCQIEKYGLEDAEEAYQSMLSGKARFRAVLVPGYKK